MTTTASMHVICALLASRNPSAEHFWFKSCCNVYCCACFQATANASKQNRTCLNVCTIVHLCSLSPSIVKPTKSLGVTPNFSICSVG